MAVNQGLVGAPVAKFADGSTPSIRLGGGGEQIVTELQGRYNELALRQRCFCAWAQVTVPVIYTTAAGTGGPLIWNGSATTNVSILAVNFGITTANTTTTFPLGWTGNTGQTAAPTSTTAIDGRANSYRGGAASLSTPYRVGTPTTAGADFWPIASVDTGAITVSMSMSNWIDIGGALILPPYTWGSLASGTAAGTAVVMHIGVMYTESPI